MDLVHGHAVGVAFGLGQQTVYGRRVRAYFFADGQVVDQPQNTGQRIVAVMVRMLMAVVMALFMPVLVLMPVLMAVAVLMVMPVRVGRFLLVFPVAAVRVPALFLGAVHGHAHVGAHHAAFFHPFTGHLHARDTQTIHLPHKSLGVAGQLTQGAHHHVAGRAHIAFQIQCLHSSNPLIWLIMLARYPAPKPLSIFTTDTPLAQLFSMDSRADRPPKLAP